MPKYTESQIDAAVEHAASMERFFNRHRNSDWTDSDLEIYWAKNMVEKDKLRNPDR
jgi:hypothetical protein